MTKAIHDGSRRFHKIKTAVLVAVIACLQACASAPKTAQYSISGEGDQVLNRDINGKSLSVVVRIYQLSDASEFSRLTFDTLAAGYPEAELLGRSLLAKTDMVLVPGGTYSNSEKLLDETRFIGVVGLFRNPDPHHWRQLVDTRDAKGNRIAGLVFRAQDCYIAIQSSRPLLLPGQPVQPKGDCGMGNVSTPPPTRQPTARGTPPDRPGTPANAQTQSSNRLPSMPEVNVNVPNSVAPANVRIGGPAGTSITIGETPPPQYPGYYPPAGSSPPPAYYPPPGYSPAPGGYAPYR